MPAFKVRVLRLSCLIAFGGGIASGAIFFSATAPAATVKVTIENIKFNPDTIEIKKGDTVVWENKDIVPHTVTSTENKFDSKNLDAQKTFKHKFTKTGSFPYKCNYHPTMSGTVTVK